MTTERLSADAALVLCRANLVRSPFAAEVLRSGLATAGRPDLEVVSAGMQVEPGHLVPVEAVEAADERGVDLSRHRARPVTPGMLVAAGLVVTMTESQRATAERMARSAIARTFTLRELVRLVGEEPTAAGSWRELAAVAHRRRPLLPPAPAAEDVQDPVGHNLNYHRAVADEIIRLCAAVVSMVRAPADTELAN